MNTQKKIKNLEQRTTDTSKALRHIHLTTKEILQEFEEQTKLTYRDFGFMLIVTSLHLVRQYLINEMTERKDHNISDKPAHKQQDNIKNQYQKQLGEDFIKDDFSKKFYYASREEIFCSHSVPYDVTAGSKTFDLIGRNKGISGVTHRHHTLGHDPLLGLYFGTANILTNTLTTTTLRTVHIANGCIVHNAQTHLMIEKFHQRISNEPVDVSFALIKQALHIWSDTYSKLGIELPLVARTKNAKILTQYGIDFGNTIKFGTQYMAAEAINNFSRLILCLLYNVNPENHLVVEPKVYKIIAGANILATSSNILQAAVTQSFAKFDFGGLLSTMKQICESRDRIAELQREFLIQEWTKKLS